MTDTDGRLRCPKTFHRSLKMFVHTDDNRGQEVAVSRKRDIVRDKVESTAQRKTCGTGDRQHGTGKTEATTSEVGSR